MTETGIMSSPLVQLPNLLLAIAMYTLLGRVALSYFFRPDSDKVIWRVFCQITHPIVAAVRIITPRFVDDMFIPPLSVAWILSLRLLLIVAAIVLSR